MVNYQLGKIYKIVCRITGEVYVGSTCEKTLAKRLVAHRADYKRLCENNPKGSVSSSQIISRGDYYIDLLEAYPCSSSDELRKKEREYFDRIECTNKCRPLLNHTDLLDDKRQAREQRTDEENEKIRIYMQNYRKEHIDDRREYDEIHKDVIRELNKKNYIVSLLEILE